MFCGLQVIGLIWVTLCWFARTYAQVASQVYVDRGTYQYTWCGAAAVWKEHNVPVPSCISALYGLAY